MKKETEEMKCFRQKISWARKKIKIMFHVFQYEGVGMARNFSKKAYLGGEAKNFPTLMKSHSENVRGTWKNFQPWTSPTTTSQPSWMTSL